MLKKNLCVYLCLITISLFSENIQYNKFTENLGNKVTEKKNILIGDFLYGETKLMSAYSAMLEREFNLYLSKLDNITIVSRKRMNDLLQETKFQTSAFMDSNAKKVKFNAAGVDAILRGRYFCNSSSVSIFIELVELKSSKILYSDKIIINLNDINSTVIPDGLENSTQNLIAFDKIIKIKPQFGLTIITKDNARNYASGSVLEFIVKSEKQCNIAVFCFQNDGTSVLLYPNKWVKNTLIPANKEIIVPGVASDFELVVGRPYGTDIIQVIACSSKSKLYDEIEEYITNIEPEMGYKIIPRGVALKKISDEYTKSNASDKNARWSESHLFISTYK